MASWSALDDELNRWRDAGRAATLWWRDDDAARPAAALDRLLALRAAAGVPLALAAIPAALTAEAAAQIEAAADTCVLQHGWAHRNHAGADGRKAELGPGRDPAAALAELATGRRRLAALLDGTALSVVVPPWNRIADGVVARLSDGGFTGVSTIGPRARARPAPGVGQVNVHVDLIDWRGSRGFVGEAAALARAVDHLAARRTGAVDGDEPTGLLSHHLVHDDAAWRFIDTFVAATRAHPSARWLAAGEAFAAAADGGRP